MLILQDNQYVQLSTLEDYLNLIEAKFGHEASSNLAELTSANSECIGNYYELKEYCHDVVKLLHKFEKDNKVSPETSKLFKQIENLI